MAELLLMSQNQTSNPNNQHQASRLHKQIVQLWLQAVARVLLKLDVVGANHLIHAYLEARVDQRQVHVKVQIGHTHKRVVVSLQAAEVVLT
jgi:hypothetical protein